MKIKKHIRPVLLSAAVAAIITLTSNTTEAAVVSPYDTSVYNVSAVMDVNQVQATKNGWVTVDGKKYYYSNGVKVTGWQTISGKKYYFGANGVMQKNWRTFSGKKYFFGSNGVMRTGWQTISGKKYYFGANGVMQKNWRTFSGKKYYFGSNGVMRTGWQTISGKKYYFGANGVMQKNWRTFSGLKFYFGADGIMRTGWQTISGKKYYFGKAGGMQTGWIKVDGKWYFMKADGSHDSSKDGKISSSFKAGIDLKELVYSLPYGEGNYYHYNEDGNYPSGEDCIVFGSNNTFSGDYAGSNGYGCKYTGKFTSIRLVDGFYKTESDCSILISAVLTDFKPAYSKGTYYYSSANKKYVYAADHPVLKKGQTYYFLIKHRPADSWGMGEGTYIDLLDNKKLRTSYGIAAGSY